MITRAGVNWISWLGWAFASQLPTARMWSAVMLAPSSVRRRFSSSTFRLYGRRAEPSTLSSLKISYDSSPTCSVLRASKLFADTTVSFSASCSAAVAKFSGFNRYLDVEITLVHGRGPHTAYPAARSQHRHIVDANSSHI
jgi:hypothetical protein